MENESGKPASRRVLLRNSLAMASAGVGVGLGLGGRRAAAQTKVEQSAVQYQATPKDGQMCSGCVNFAPPNACNIVAGNISPNGWCIAYAPKG